MSFVYVCTVHNISNIIYSEDQTVEEHFKADFRFGIKPVIAKQPVGENGRTTCMGQGTI
jgi:hypothetical protein